MATINGTPSIFQTPVTPVPVINPDAYSTAFVGIATDMVAETEAQRHTNCPACQEQMVHWRTANPTANEADAEKAHEQIWSECPACVAEYCEWSEGVERATDAEAEFEAHLCSQYDAEAAELASLGDAGQHAIAGHDAVWQAGGEI